MKYRVGNHLGRTIYRDDQLIGLMDTEADASLIVRLLNNDVIERDGSCNCLGLPCFDGPAGSCCGAGECSCSLPREAQG